MCIECFGVVFPRSVQYRNGYGAEGASHDQSVRSGGRLCKGTSKTVAASRPLAIRDCFEHIFSRGRSTFVSVCLGTFRTGYDTVQYAGDTPEFSRHAAGVLEDERWKRSVSECSDDDRLHQPVPSSVPAAVATAAINGRDAHFPAR